MAETVQASQQDGHFNESIVNEEILEDMKKNRIDHMKYLPDMEQLEESDVMDQVISAMNAYDYDKYTEADVRRALAHDNRTPEDFQALLSPAALPLLEEIAQAARIETRKHFGNSVCMFTPIYIANYCENYCIYCGFNCHNKIRRAQLNEEDPLDFSLMQENLRTIEQSVMRIDRIVLDLMDTVSIEQGRLALSLVPSDLGALLHSVEKDFSSHPSPGNNQLVLTIQPNLPEISADPERLIQVITNLISNAERHTQNGTITISLSGEPGWQTICVSDTGTGMSEEMRKNALKGYVSADKDYWRHGIGLYVCHQIITAHGGKIWLKSKEGEGTQVFFSLPEEES